MLLTYGEGYFSWGGGRGKLCVCGVIYINSDTVSLTAELEKTQFFSKTEQLLLPLDLMGNVLLNIRKRLNNLF